MAAIHGFEGTASFSGATLLITSWTLNTTVDIAESTSMADSTAGYKEYLAGWKDWTATIETNYDSGGLALSTLGTTASLTLDTSTGLQYVAQAICTGHSLTDDMGDVVKTTWSFQGTGAIVAS